MQAIARTARGRVWLERCLQLARDSIARRGIEVDHAVEDAGAADEVVVFQL